MPDKFTATWVSHSSISDFLACPRGYYLKNVYRNPESGRKMKLMSPPLALGQAVHEVIEALSVLPVADRLKEPLISRFSASWAKIEGKKGGFFSAEAENTYKMRGQDMINRVRQNPGPVAEKAVKIKQDLPWYWLSEEEEIILCGKLDWLEYVEKTNSVRITDFKTGKNREDNNSLQLPIYLLLATNCQQFTVSGAQYWYLEQSDTPEEVELPHKKQAEEQILQIARDIKLARKFEKYACPHGGCRVCKPYERILQGDGEYVGKDQYNADIYILPPPGDSNKGAVIL